MSRIMKIVAATDLSELSKLGVRYALEMARDSSAEVIVYHTIEVGGNWTDGSPIGARYRDLLEDSRRILDKFLADNFADCIDLVEVRAVAELGVPERNITAVAEREGADLIVMSTHGRTGLDHMILGSVAEKVVARASCPVLVVPRRKARAAIAA